jgi:very-short-patch-repair endonuclease
MPDRLVRFARELRRNSTDAERLLWRHLRAKRFANTKFKRQATIGPYIVDFVSFHRKLIVELDGPQHLDEDPGRQGWLEGQGFDVLRFWNNDVLTNTDAVWTQIVVRVSPSPQPSPVEGGVSSAADSP